MMDYNAFVRDAAVKSTLHSLCTVIPTNYVITEDSQKKSKVQSHVGPNVHRTHGGTDTKSKKRTAIKLFRLCYARGIDNMM